MGKLLFFLLLSYQTNAQVFIDLGVNYQRLSLTYQQSPALNAIVQLTKDAGGDDRLFRGKIILSSIVPKFSIGYRVPMDFMNILASVGTSQDFKNSTKLDRVVSVRGKNYPVPVSFAARLQISKTWRHLLFGVETVYDSQRSEFLLNGSNLDPQVIGLLNQITDNMNLLDIGTQQFMQFNGLVGYQENRGHLQFEAVGLIGRVGNSIGIQGNLKLRIYLNKLSINN